MKRSLLLILISACLPLGFTSAQQTPAPRPATPGPPARRNSAYDDAVAKARALAAQKDFKAAAITSEQAIQMDDKRWEGYVVAAESYSGQRLYDDAIGMLEAALVRAPTDKKPAVRDAISETRKLLLPKAAPQVSAGTPNPNAINNDNGPSLEVTMKFIQDKLNEQGPINYTETLRSGNHLSVEWSHEVSNVTADPKTCIVSYHRRTSENNNNNKSATAQDERSNLKDVKKIVVWSEEQLSSGPGVEVSVMPEVRDVVLYKAGDLNAGLFEFLDDDLANRVAKALTHAVELCAAKRAEEPF